MWVRFFKKNKFLSKKAEKSQSRHLDGVQSGNEWSRSSPSKPLTVLKLILSFVCI